MESWLSGEINDSEFLQNVANDARSALKGMVDDAFRMDDIGKEDMKMLKSVLNEFRSWCNQKHAESRREYYSSIMNVSKVNKKRKHVRMKSDRYTSSVNRVFNTHHVKNEISYETLFKNYYYSCFFLDPR